MRNSFKRDSTNNEVEPRLNGLLEILKWKPFIIQQIELCIASQGSNSLPHERPKISKSTYTEMKLFPKPTTCHQDLHI